ncbi:hypothetical protein KC367_g277 [Hortaea werneckii]|nr:hypothetical protein KC367_g277 [Hortaea werneckii]
MIIVELDLFGFAGTMVANSHLIRMKLAERHSDTLVIILPGYYYSQHPIPRFTFIIETIHRCRVGDLTAHRLPRTSRRNHAKDAMAANHRAVPGAQQRFHLQSKAHQERLVLAVVNIKDAVIDGSYQILWAAVICDSAARTPVTEYAAQLMSVLRDLHAEPQPGCAALVCSILAANAERLFRERRIVSRRSRGFDIHRRFAYAIESQKPRHSVIANSLVRKLKTVVVALSFGATIDLRLV